MAESTDSVALQTFTNALTLGQKGWGSVFLREDTSTKGTSRWAWNHKQPWEQWPPKHLTQTSGFSLRLRRMPRNMTKQWYGRPGNEGWWWFKPGVWMVLIAVSKLWFIDCIFKCLTSQTLSDSFIRWTPVYSVSKKTRSKSFWGLIYLCSRKQSSIPFGFRRQHGSGPRVVQPAHKAALSTPKKASYSVAKLVTERHTEEPNIGSMSDI